MGLKSTRFGLPMLLLGTPPRISKIFCRRGLARQSLVEMESYLGFLDIYGVGFAGNPDGAGGIKTLILDDQR